MVESAGVKLSRSVRDELVERKVTCPFLGSAVATCQLPVRNEAINPLASVDDITVLGNTGGGDLGDLLALFACGNHAYMRGASGRLDKAVPAGLFSLELPGSQGSHPGHSGILQADPDALGSGRLSQADFARLASRAQEGAISRPAVGRFIAENLARDPDSKVFGTRVAGLLARDLAELAGASGAVVLSRLGGKRDDSRAHRNLIEKLTRVLGEDNLLGSAGEWGLLFAFLAHKPGAKTSDGDPTVSLDDVRAMFVEKRLPTGWEDWKKTRLDWAIATSALAASAGRAYLGRRTRPQ